MRALWSRLWGAFDGLAGDTIWGGVHDVFALVASMTSFVLLQQALTRSGYGALFGLYGLIGPLGSLTFAGPGLALLQRRLRFGQDQNEILRSFLSMTLVIGLGTSALAIGLAVAYIDLSLLEITLVVASELFANATIVVCSRLMHAVHGYPAMIRVRLVVVALRLVAVVGLHALGALTIRNLATSYLIMYSAYVAWLLAKRLPAAGYRVALERPTMRTARTSAVFAVPLAASSLQQDGDKFALNAFNYGAEAGLYGAAYRIVHLGGTPLRVISAAAFHRFLPDDAVGSSHHLRKSARLTGFMFLVGTVTALAIYVALPVLDLLLSDDFAEAREIVPWLLPFLPLIALSGTPMNGLLGLGRAKERAAVFLSSSAVSVALYLALIPGRGWRGAVAATIGSELYLAVVSWAAIVYYQRLADRDQAAEPRAAEPVIG
ncbi:MAG: polysaccharide biosynthesis C-terminal domain-containing protein [Acidimicrobiia bacterium]|nr:polysaccharide biosynthesis C-terminal domain-containing protein [Acidimicrobiia bacterium]MDH5521906.1 polysaccharide biosynthesis C-terminal domain-containing protein [Acidimicrobiia bacterium]